LGGKPRRKDAGEMGGISLIYSKKQPTKRKPTGWGGNHLCKIGCGNRYAERSREGERKEERNIESRKLYE